MRGKGELHMRNFKPCMFKKFWQQSVPLSGVARFAPVNTSLPVHDLAMLTEQCSIPCMHCVSGKSLTINQVTFNTNLVYTFICIYENNQILVKNVIFYLYDLNLVCKQDTYQIVLLRILTDPPCLCYIVQII